MWNLNLLVLRCRDIHATRAFYELLGLRFELHRHGSGPEHLAAERDGGVIELYPAAGAPDTVGLGFAVDDLAASIAALTAGGFEASPPRDNPWGRSSVTRDPDGRRVELTQKA